MVKFRVALSRDCTYTTKYIKAGEGKMATWEWEHDKTKAAREARITAEKIWGIKFTQTSLLSKMPPKKIKYKLLGTLRGRNKKAFIGWLNKYGVPYTDTRKPAPIQEPPHPGTETRPRTINLFPDTN